MFWHKACSVGLALWWTATPAQAEVCDKVRPRWDPAGGPATQIDELIHFALSPLGPLTVLILAGPLLLRRTWGYIGGTIAFIALAALIFAGWRFDPTGLTQSARIEGCLTAPVLPIFTLLTLALALLWWPRKSDL